MQLGMIGLGRMGSSMVGRLVSAGHHCVVHDVDKDAVARFVDPNIVGAVTLKNFVANLTQPRAIWLMVPAAVVDPVLSTLAPLLDEGDIIIDGGNSYYGDDIRRASELKARAIHYLDVGTSGGVAGLNRGYCLMIGGEPSIVQRVAPIFESLASGVEGVSRTAGKSDLGSAEQGYLHCGPHGAGHFVKMIHNGIEYGLMAAYAEGLNILRRANTGGQAREADAETTPLRNPELYRFEFNLPAIVEVWRRGSVIGSWLLDLTASALRDDADLDDFAGRVSDSGEGRWTVAAAIDLGVPAHVISAALFARFTSRGEADYADRILSAMRKQFGGHDEKARD